MGSVNTRGCSVLTAFAKPGKAERAIGDCVRCDAVEAAMVRRQAAAIGLTKSAHASNLVLRGLAAEARAVLPVTIEDRKSVV